ncbi:MAG: multicopper oxidase domain-containing protein [Candidatus Promineifilaceae bacterium]
MNYRKIINYSLMVCLLAAVLLLVAGSSSQANAKPKDPPNNTVGCRGNNGQGKGQGKCPKEEYDNRQTSAAQAYQQGRLNPLMVEAQAAAPLIDGAPHYFSHPNYANSPLPEVWGDLTYFGNPLVDRGYSSDNASNVFVVVPAALPDGMIQSFQTWNQVAAGGSPASAGLNFHAYVLRPTGFADEYTVIFDSGQLTVPALTDPAVSEFATFGVANLAVQAGDMLAFYGRGIPLDIGAGSDMVYYPSPAGPLQGSTITVGVAPDFPTLAQARTYSFGAQVIDITAGGTDLYSINGGMRKFVDTLPGLDAANNLGQQIPVAVPDTTTYPGTDYYIIELGEYTEQMHSDLPPTTLRGYRQAGGEYHYLGPAIVAQKDRPVRILFRNLLPTGEGGNLFIPVDSTVMGSGPTPEGHMLLMNETFPFDDPQNPPCSGPNKDSLVAQGLCFSDSRAIVHLHGGITPWISDGTPHQWITPAGESTDYPQGTSVRPVPDMNDGGNPTDGEMTFYYTNQQSARLMFYHDHAWGITRLNVYAGMAAPYIIQDATEQALVDAGTIPGPNETIPLVVQDKTFVPNDAQLALQDESWDTARWGGEGSLWVPHVYSPAQNPGAASGVNEYGRWAYGPWFWPPTNSIDHGPIDNPYFDPACDPDTGTWCEPSLIPGTPYNSMGMESFNDTPIVNGTAYPTITLEPKAYRFRILNAANDRFFNLSLYQAIDANGVLCDANNPNPAPESTGVACTEVYLNPDEVAAALADPAGIFPTPVIGTEGPNWIDIATEGGFLPAPVVVQAHPTTWVTDPTLFNAGNVDQHSLLIAPAERHDAIVDFSQFAGQTLILYNDAPAAFPARDPRYDYYTGNPDLRDTGGAPSTLPGYGPNTRTVMQIRVADAPADAPFDLAALQNAFKATSLGGQGIFENGQNPIIVGQGEYNSAYGTTFPTNGALNGTVQIYDTSLTFNTLSGNQLTFNLKPKMIQDEMGEAFEMEYGRMSGFLGVETPNAQAGLQNMILHGYTYPPDEIIDGLELPPGVEVQPIATTDDGTQIWKFTHNGVDTHPIHFHLYDVQLINRVGWDGIVRKPDATELGWKDTVRISPLEDTIVAIRPIIPGLPAEWGGLPNSIRLLDPSMPEGMYLDGANTTQREAMGLPIMAFNPDGEPVDIVNHYVNFGWEYVYHCHILSHEEMDMMHAQVVGVEPTAPIDLIATKVGNGGNRRYELSWTDTSKNETGFVIERSTTAGGPWEYVATVDWGLSPGGPDFANGPGTGTRTYTDAIGNPDRDYFYNVYAINVVGDTWDYSDPAFNNIPPGGGWPTLTLDSRGGEGPVDTIEAPTDLVANAVVKNKKSATVTLNWTDNATSETGFLVQRAYDAGFTSGVMNATVGPDVESFSETVARGVTFYYRVHAFSDTTQSTWSNTTTVTTP